MSVVRCYLIILVAFFVDDPPTESMPFFRKDYIFNWKTQNFYKLHTTNKTWVDARHRCKLEGATLFIPDSKTDTEAAVNIIEAKYHTPVGSSGGGPIDYNFVWIGISDQFSEGDYFAEDGQSIDDVYVDWAEGEPDNNNNEDCIVLADNGQISDVSCAVEAPFICKKSHTLIDWNEACNLPDLKYTYDKTLEKCYKLHSIPKNWTDAFTVCTAEESYLAIINSVAEAEFLVKCRGEAPKDSSFTYLGFHNQYLTGWTTIKGQTLEEAGYAVWGARQPDNAEGQGDERCGTMFTDGTLNDSSCSLQAAFICEHDIKPSIPPPIIYRTAGGSHISEAYPMYHPLRAA